MVQLIMQNTANNSFTPILLRWFSENKRDLPWRNTADAYAIWLSEVILQQTRIQQGRAYWERFIERFPRVENLAEATEDEVLRLWQGLGYYTRARNLHHAARQIVANNGFPTTYDGIRKLKGVGDYTAAAVASIAFGLPVAAIDGNVYRVLSRVFGIDTPINSTEGKKTFAALAQSLLPPAASSAFNQALMDFGATLCTPQSPRCMQCPFTESCEALRTGRTALLPVKRKTLKIQTRRMDYIYIRYNDFTALRRRPKGDIWQGLWEPLLVENGPMPALDGHLSLLRKQVKHVLTHRIILSDFYLLQTDARPLLPEDYVWVPEKEVENYALPRLIELLLEEVKTVIPNRLYNTE